MIREITATGQPPQPPRDILREEFLNRMGSELVRLCDSMERHGLVDYQMGVWEEEILDCRFLQLNKRLEKVILTMLAEHSYYGVFGSARGTLRPLPESTRARFQSEKFHGLGRRISILSPSIVTLVCPMRHKHRSSSYGLTAAIVSFLCAYSFLLLLSLLYFCM